MTNDVMAAENRLEMALGLWSSHLEAHGCWDATKHCQKRADLLEVIRGRRGQLQRAESDERMGSPLRYAGYQS
ncbi:MAG: hypothetical protein WA751_02870 [Candidatus Dormiibacterota bacterium]